MMNSLAFNRTQVLCRVLALPVCVCSKGLFLHTHVFRELFSLHPCKKTKLFFLFFPLGTWTPVIRAALSVQCRLEPALTTSPIAPPPFLPQPGPMEEIFRKSRNSVSH